MAPGSNTYQSIQGAQREEMKEVGGDDERRKQRERGDARMMDLAAQRRTTL